jgi:hypothetical protein
LGLPPLIGILRGMRRATSDEIFSDILDAGHEDVGPGEVDSNDAKTSDPGRDPGSRIAPGPTAD